MTLEEVKQKFKTAYTRNWLKLTEETEDTLSFTDRSDSAIKITREELQSYLDLESRKDKFETKPFETSLCNPSHYEQLITSASRYSLLLMHLGTGKRILFGEEGVDSLTVEISEASFAYKTRFRFHEYHVSRTLDRIRMNRPRIREGISRNFFDYVYAPTTIKVSGLNEANAEIAANKALELIEGCLFNLSYLRGESIVLEEELPKRQVMGSSFRFEDYDNDSQLPLPKSSINRDVARFYQRGIGTEDPANQFLSYYQVLEYFFLAVSDEELYRKLSSVIHDPVFSTKPRHLDKLIQSTLNHKRESDETEMLRLVLAKHVDEHELIEFIGAYENHLAEKRFTKKKKIFGEDNEVKTSPGHVIGNVAKRVKLIRNALVHSSDRYNRQENFVPTRAAEAEIKMEVPLVKYLAERVIIGSST